MCVGSDASPGLGLASPGLGLASPRCQFNMWPSDHLSAFRPQCCCLCLGWETTLSCFALRHPCNSPALLSSCIYQVLSSCSPCQHLMASKFGAQLCREPSVQDQTCLQITPAGWLDRDGVLGCTARVGSRGGRAGAGSAAGSPVSSAAKEQTSQPEVS